jgi:arylsulfatase A-like enzyme
MQRAIILIMLPILAGMFTTGCKEPAKPNVVFILTDQWRASAFGYTGDPNVRTPNLDSLAAASVSFDNAVSVCPVCTPYRASLLTGRFPTSTGMFMNDIYLPEDELCMAEIYRSAGYQTAYIGKWHLDGHGRLNNVAPERRQGFEYWKALECSHDYNRMPYYEGDSQEMKYWDGYSPFALVGDACRYLEVHAQDEQPFLLFLSIATPHFPHETAPEEYMDLYPVSGIKLNPNVPVELYDRVYPEIQGYYAHCTATDEAIGQLVERLKNLDLDENTILVFTSDHGEMMGAHGRLPYRKQLAWDESLHVPFLIRYPGMPDSHGAKIKAPLTTPDILPSLLSLCGIEIPESIEGDDLSGLMLAPDPEADRAALVMNVAPFDVNHLDPEYRGIRTARYTYAVSPEGPIMFFDDLEDPFQLNNLVNQPDYEDLRQDLDLQLRKELSEIGDEDFKPRIFYIDRWGFELEKNNINYWSFYDGEGKTQSPELKPK